MSYFIPCNINHDASYIDNLFFKELIRIHGLPINIFYDRDVKFMGHFLKYIVEWLGTNLAFSSTYHPQTNGQIEVVNRVLGNLHRYLPKEYGQVRYQVFPQEEFSFNESTKRSPRKNPFEIIDDLHPRGVCEIGEFKNHEEVSEYANDLSQSMREVHEHVKKNLIEANNKLKTKVDERRKDLKFGIGDWVMVHLNTT